ncbi:DUF2635 domain-containing protein [Bosea sp. (in: a-proteobacteria)]|uniref:DUF2635 domain-containing protein n=1 Tax=Bosea sp. (in: a-proteobacteria) TaxID=1871050 RepID=UPI0027324C86|nr:DUF2635 domain-containing protein [Bosea sp. (in: a-proteobacteria)]MDP3407238.1 DUF2635 domain-containing protein [Bosea sp. (in: a-proteobacteria)]
MSPTATLVDVRPQPGRRVRDQEGSLLPETHILRGVPRSTYWLRLERDGDVTLAAHEPEIEAEPETPAPEASGPEAAAPEAPEPESAVAVDLPALLPRPPKSKG